jgi:hypothetical protein
MKFDRSTGVLSFFSGTQASQTDFAVFNATGLNSTAIGATTPATGAFTTLGASGLVTVQTAGGTAAAINLYAGNNTTTSKLSIGQIGAIDWDLGVTATNGWFQIGGLGGTMPQAYTIARSGTGVTTHTFYTGGAARSEISSTGLAVTGALSSTGDIISVNTGVSTQRNVSVQNSAGSASFAMRSDGRAQLSNTGTTGTPDLVIGHTGGSGNGNVFVSVNNSTIATISSTGLAVTGTLSSTGILSGPGFRASKVTATSGLVKIQDEGANVYNVIGSRNNADNAALPLVFQGSNFDFVGAVAVTGALSSTGALAIGNTVNTVSPTSPNRTVTIVIGGTTYYLAAKTTND